MKKKIFLLCLLLLLILGGVAFYILSQPPKEKLSEEFKDEAVTRLLGRKAQLSNDTPRGDTEYKGKYISFKYPAKALVYKFRENSTSSGSASLEDFSFDLKEPTVTFNLNISRNSSNLNSITDSPAFKLRELRDYEYKKSQIKINNINGVAFSKNENGIERSAFILHNNLIYAISVSGVEESSTALLFEKVISSIAF